MTQHIAQKEGGEGDGIEVGPNVYFRGAGRKKKRKGGYIWDVKEVLKVLMKKEAYSGRQLAVATGWCTSAVAGWLKGTVPIRVKDLIDILDVLHARLVIEWDHPEDPRGDMRWELNEPIYGEFRGNQGSDSEGQE